MVYVVGGETKEGTFSANEAYHPATDQWRSMAPMPTARHELGVAAVRGRFMSSVEARRQEVHLVTSMKCLFHPRLSLEKCDLDFQGVAK
ncbi:MAG: hypothetical protein ACWA6R_12740 [Nitrosomonas sp.]